MFYIIGMLIRHTLNLLTTAVVLACLFTPNQAAGFSVENDGGGEVGTYIGAAEYATQIEFSGYCRSACTAYLSVENICVNEGASFGFHQARDVDNNPLPEYTERLLAIYPEWVLSWLEGQELPLDGFIHMNYETAVQYVPDCSNVTFEESGVSLP